MSNQQVGARRASLQVLEISQQHLVAGNVFEYRGIRGRYRRGNLATHLGKPARQRPEQVRLRSDRDLPAPEEEMSVKHRVHKLTALTTVLVGNRPSTERHQIVEEPVI